jgi:hypothetical protein
VFGFTDGDAALRFASEDFECSAEGDLNEKGFLTPESGDFGIGFGDGQYGTT